MQAILDRLRHTKMLLTSLVLTVLGIGLIALNKQLDAGQADNWLRYIPWSEIGGILIGMGVLSIWIDHLFRREPEASTDLRLRQIFHDEAPAMRDAVLEAFAADDEDLARVATPATLDRIINNSLALRLRDKEFAAEMFDDIRHQVIDANERWTDAELNIDLAPHPKPSAADDYFAVTVRWEYTTTPTHAERRFVCLSDRQKYSELTQAHGHTSPWYLKPNEAFDATDRDAFELLRFTVDGKDRPIRRLTRKENQTYAATLPEEAAKARKPITISYTYRTVTRRQGHLLFFDIEQPTRDININFDYTGCSIHTVSAIDLIPSVRPSRIEHSPPDVPNQTIHIDIDGWTFPRSGIAFVWTLEDELARTRRNG